MRHDLPEGYKVPFHQSLIRPILAGGIDRNLCFGLWSIGISIGIMMKMYWFLPIVLAIHLLIREFTKTDDMFFKVFVNHMHNKKIFW